MALSIRSICTGKTARAALLGLCAIAVAACGTPQQKPGAPYHHTTNGFRNPPDSPVRNSWTDRAGWLFSRIWAFAGTAEASALPPNHVMPRDESLAQFKALEGQDTVTWIGHMTALLRLEGKTVLTDPWLTDYATPIPPLGPKRIIPPAFDFGDLPKIDIVVLSHSHFEHLDLRTIRRLPGKEDIIAVVPLKLGHYFTEAGYGRVIELDWHETTDIDGIEITALPVIHWSKRSLFRTNDTLWAGFAIETASGRRIYFGGDAEYGPVYKRVADREPGFDLALMSIGAYMPRVVMNGSHCVPEDCVRIALDLNSHAMVGMHWGTVRLSDEPLAEPAERFAEAARAAGLGEDRAWIMRIGETRVLPRRPGASS